MAWLHLYCGSGKALVQAAEAVHAWRLEREIVGLDLIGSSTSQGPTCAACGWSRCP